MMKRVTFADNATVYTIPRVGTRKLGDQQTTEHKSFSRVELDETIKERRAESLKRIKSELSKLDNDLDYVNTIINDTSVDDDDDDDCTLERASDMLVEISVSRMNAELRVLYDKIYYTHVRKRVMKRML